MTRVEHVQLLAIVRALPPGVQVMISGYPSKLYDEALAAWERKEFTVYTRNHQPRREVLWMNYSPPHDLHDLRFVGDNFRERYNLKRRIKRWTARLARMEPLEREAIFAAMRATVQRWDPVTPEQAME